MKTKQINYIIGLIILLCLMVLISCKTVDPAARYAKVHNDNSFVFEMDTNDSFSVGSLKEDVKALKKKLSELKKDNNNKSKVEKLELTLIELRKQIEEIETNK